MAGDDERASGDDSICVGCGLCCDGTLYGYVELADGDDREVFVRLGRPAERATEDGPWVAPQPCVASVAARCAIYDDRPQRCRRYRCDLLTAVDDGRETADAARVIVAKAVEHRDRVRALARRLAPYGDADPDGRRFHSAMRLVAARTVDVAAMDRAELLLDYGALRTRLGRHFRTSDPWVMGAPADAGPPADGANT